MTASSPLAGAISTSPVLAAAPSGSGATVPSGMAEAILNVKASPFLKERPSRRLMPDSAI